MSDADAALLVVDDIEDNRFALSRRLARHGYLNVTTAADGQQALELLNSKPFDLVLLDIMMPNVNGYEVLAQMKASSSLRHIPVIMISAVDEIESVIRCIELGAEDYLPKPFNPTLLRARVGACLERKRLHDQVVARTRELSESLEQQTATSEVLQVISSSPGELEPVFQAMLANATRLCEAKFATLYLCEGDGFRAVAMHNAPLAFAEARAQAGIIHPHPDTTLARAASTKRAAQITDVTTSQAYVDRDPLRMAAVALGGYRTVLSVPMLREDTLAGVIGLYCHEVRPFTDKQIALVENFAAQAVIAIENTRLLNELRKSLQQQTATSEVLQVISSSPGELEPVFQAMLENATRICEAKFGTLFRFEGDAYRAVASHNAPPELAASYREHGLRRPNPGTLFERMVRTKQVCHTADYAAEPFPGNAARLGGARSFVCVPMLKDDELIGALAIYRHEVRPFADKQIELVKNFAEQAVIAIENTRLLNELRQRTDDLSEALEQQTATSEVLQVISSSPGHLGPVFQALLANAVRICEAKLGTLVLYEGQGSFRHVAAHGAPAAYAELRRREPRFTPNPGTRSPFCSRSQQPQPHRRCFGATCRSRADRSAIWRAPALC